MFGYQGKILRVDLTDRKIEVESLDASLCEKYIGGAGIGAKLLYDETSADTDPLGPENRLIAFTGPFTGTAAPSAGRHHVMARSPLNGLFGESNVGGSWAVHFKKTGFDGIIVRGRADRPVYLWIHDGGAEIRDAGPIWGRDAYDSARWLKAETAQTATAAVIGPAGERQAGIAGIPHIGVIVRQAARVGLGAVMGSKNLKAMVAYGTQATPLAQGDAFKAAVKALLPHIRKATETFGKYGTAGGVENYEKIGNFPLQNWRGSHWPGAKAISGVTMHDTILTGRKACFACPIACGRHIGITEGPYAPLECAGPEYETIGLIGGACLIDDLAVICKANDLCNRYGLDTISVGATIAFAMEAFEKGIIGKADTDGVELTWGNGPALLTMIGKIARGEGIGELMGEGSAKMAAALGKNAVRVCRPRQGARTVGPRSAAVLQPGPVLRDGGAGGLPQCELEPSLRDGIEHAGDRDHGAAGPLPDRGEGRDDRQAPGPDVRHGFADPLPVRPGRQGGQRRQHGPVAPSDHGPGMGCPGVHAGRGTGLQPQEALQHTPGDQPQGRFSAPPVSDPQQEGRRPHQPAAPHGPSPCRLLRGSRVDRGRHPLGGKAQGIGDTRVMRSSLFLFDFDGVLVDSLDLYAEAVARCLERIGTPIVKNREEYLVLFDGNFYESMAAKGVDLAAFAEAAREIMPRDRL